MKHIYKFLLIILIPICGFSQNPIILELNLAKGDSFLIEYHVYSITNQEIMGVQQTIKTHESMTFLFTFTDVSPDKTYSVQLICKSYKSKIESQDILETFNSDSIDQYSGFNYIRTFIGKAIHANINLKGLILSFDNSAIENGLDTLSEIDENSKLIAKNRFGEQIPKSILSFFRFPSKPIRINEVWTVADTVSQYPFYFTEIESSFDELSEKTFTLKQTGKIYSDHQKFYKTNRIFISYQLNGCTMHTCNYNRVNGMFEDADTEQSVTGTVRMKYSENSDTEYQWPITIKNEIKLKSKKI